MSAQRASQLVEAGLWLRLSGDHEGAKRLFEQALKIDPANARARQLLDSPPPPPAPPGTVTKTTMDLDWAAATGKSPTPPPVPPVAPPIVKSDTRPFGQGAAPGTHTIRLGEALAPEIPEVPRFDDPHGEIQITGADDEEHGEKSTLVFGMSGVPVPPVAPSEQPPASGTLVFGSSKDGPVAPPAIKPMGGRGNETLVFGNIKDTPPTVPPVSSPGTGTMVFSGQKLSPPSVPPVGGTMQFGIPKERDPDAPGGTMVFGNQGPSEPPVGAQALDTGTLVFGSQSAAPPPAAPSNAPGTLVFGSQAAQPPAPSPPAKAPGTLVFGSSSEAPPSKPQIASSRDEPVITEPGVPPFAVPEPVARIASSTLQFNFDDMVSPPPGPLPSPPVPRDSDDDDGPKTAWDRSNPRIDISQIQPGEGGGLDLISAPPPPPKPRSPAQLRQEVSTLLSGAKDLLDLDDHSGAMELINKALELDPTDAGVLKLKERSERTLTAMFESKLGDLDQTPRVKLKDDEIIWLNLDHRAGFVLAQIDGSVSYEDLFAVSGMSRLDTARILAQLVEEGVISKG